MDLRYFKNEGDGVFSILLHGVVGDQIDGREVASEIHALNRMGAKIIRERINTLGGSIVHGYSIVSANLVSDAEIHTFNEGVADSTGAWILASGTPGKRGSFDFASVFLHNPTFDGKPIEEVEDENIRKQMQIMADSIVTILTNNSNKTKKEVKEAMNKCLRLKAREAKDFGLIDFVEKSANKPVLTENMSVAEIMNVCNEFMNFNGDSSRTADTEPSWGTVNKRKLPREAFAEDRPDNPSEWGYPHHFVTGGAVSEDTGRFTSGTMFLHKGGLNAAWAAAMGARTGKKADSFIISHIRKHRDALGLESSENVVDVLKLAANKTEKNNILKANNKINTMETVAKFFNLSPEATEEAIMAEVQKLQNKAEKAEGDLASLKKESEKKDTEIENLKKEVDGFKDQSIEAAVDAAITAGKFGEDDKDDLVETAKEIGLDNFNKMVEKQKPAHVNVAGSVTNSTSAKKKTGEERKQEEKVANAKEYQKLSERDPDALGKMENTNPEKFNTIYEDWCEVDLSLEETE